MTTTTTSTPIPALLSVLFSVTNSSEASLCLRGHCEPTQRIMIVHEGRDVKNHTMAGDGTLLSLPVTTGDLMTITVRQAGTMIGCGVYEVQLHLAEIYGAILVPKSVSDLILDQLDADIVERGDQRRETAHFAPETATVY